MINPQQRSIPFYAGVALTILFFTSYIVRSYSFLPHDFANSYFGAYFFLNGEFDTDIFDPYTFNKMIYDAGFKDVFASYNPNPPSTAMLFLPAALLPLSLSKLFFNIITSVLFLVSIYRLCKHLQADVTWAFIVLPILFFTPLRNQMLFGQTYFLVIFLLIEGFLAYENKRLWLAAVLWSFAVFLKIFPLIIILFLVVKKEWKTIGYLAACGAAMLAVCVLVQGTDVWAYYFTEVLPRSNAGQVTTAYESNFQSAQMFFKYLFVADTQLNPSPVVDSQFMYSGSLVVFKSLVLTLSASFILRSKPGVAFGMIFLTSILLLSYGSTYGNLVLVLLVIGLNKELSKPKMAIVTLVILLICTIPVDLFRDLPTTLQFPRFVVLVGLFLMILFFLSTKIEWKFLVVFLPIMILPELYSREVVADPSALLVPDQKHSLVYNYYVMDKIVVYNYWTDRGENSFVTNIQVEQNPEDAVELKENQIYYDGKQVTFTDDHKLKPTLFDGHKLVYLSDKDRGIGFYTLRVIDLNKIYRFNPPS